MQDTLVITDHRGDTEYSCHHWPKGEQDTLVITDQEDTGYSCHHWPQGGIQDTLGITDHAGGDTG